MSLKVNIHGAGSQALSARAPGPKVPWCVILSGVQKGQNSRCSEAEHFWNSCIPFSNFANCQKQTLRVFWDGKNSTLALHIKQWRVPKMLCLYLFTFLTQSEVWAVISPTQSSLGCRLGTRSVPLSICVHVMPQRERPEAESSHQYSFLTST